MTPEDLRPGPPEDTAVDEHNNIVGNLIGETPGMSCAKVCEDAIRSGFLKITR